MEDLILTKNNKSSGTTSPVEPMKSKDSATILQQLKITDVLG